MPSFNRPTNPESSFVTRILNEVLKRLPQAYVVPVVQNDPPDTDPTNLWMRPDGRLRGRYWNGASFTYVDYPMRSDITSPPAVPAAPAPPAKPSTPKTYQKTYTATWSQSYQGSGAKRVDSIGETYLVFGDSGADTYGTQRALVGFDYATIATDLASSTIHKVELRMTNVHSYWDSGVDVFFGMHNVTSEPATWPASGSLPLRRVVNHRFGKTETKIVPLQVQFGQLLRAGTAKGLAIEAPTAEKDYYGYAAGFGSGFTPPQLIITYAK
jgi:hypothetical protein